MKITVDGMGGDHAPQVVAAGAVEAAREWDFEIILVGDEPLLRAELKKHGKVPQNLSVRHAGSFVRMDESAAIAIRKKKDASISVCADMVKEGAADAIVTAGHTGAAVVASTLKLRLLEGVERAGIGVLFPTLTTPTFLIDAGANLDTKAVNLYQYAVMGETYYRTLLKKEKPSVGILNVGEEETKGMEYIKEAGRLLGQSRLHFIGNVEGRDIFRGSVDIVVCDGFVGNVVLKVSESIGDVAGRLLKMELKKSWVRMLGALLAKPAFEALKKKMDYSEYGGAPLLGIDGICIISHGSSNVKAIKNAIRVASEFVKHEVNQHIVEAIREGRGHSARLPDGQA